MGIPGVLKEIGRGDRVALAKLAIEHLEQTQRPLRIAIDAAIWNFQTQAGQGGKNPALRTLYYRLLRILALPIHPLFVYDGKNKPLSKRGQTVSRYGTCLANETSKKLLEQLRFPSHTAPGEAEAECAQLQRQGIVDMVMSQDGDAILFGSRMTLRNWSREGARGNKEPTHVDVLDLQKIKDGPGLDPDGMILVALLSGGDYNQQGLPGFGVHVACDIARAGFGRDLLEAIRSNDDDALRDWRERLEYELETNESGYFKKRHKTLKIPQDFPDRTILNYYTDPAISTADVLKQLEKKWRTDWQAEIDVTSLRAYTGDTFDWQHKPGAWKLVRTLARPLLAHRLQNGLADHLIHTSDQIHERRKHYTMGGIPELRLSAAPTDIVGLDLEAEADGPECLAMHEGDKEVDDEGDDMDDTELGTQSPSKPKKAAWNPYQPEKMWLPETLVELGVPAILEEWNQLQRDKMELHRAKPARKLKTVKHAKESERIDRYFAVARPVESVAIGTAVAPIEISNATTLEKELEHDPRTPSRKPGRRDRAVSDVSPDLMHYFKPAKSSQQTDLGEAQIQSRRNFKHPRASPSPSPSRDDLQLPPISVPSFSGSWEDPVPLTSSPRVPTIGFASVLTPQTPHKAASEDDTHTSPSIRDLEMSVTQRRPRRVRKKLERSRTEGATPLDDSTPLDGPMSALVSTKAHQKPGSQSSTNAALPNILGTGLRTDFQRRKVYAMPRESLEGTWKEAGLDEQVITSKTRRQQRVSCVDITAD